MADEHAVAERGRTTVGACGLAEGELLPFIAGFLGPEAPESPNAELPVAIALKAACEDLKQIYLEAASAQPTPAGTARPTHAQQNDWFWRETRAAELLRTTADRIRQLDEPGMEMVASYLLLLFHTGMVFNPAPFYHIRNDDVSLVFLVLCGFISLWHMPLFFLLKDSKSCNLSQVVLHSFRSPPQKTLLNVAFERKPHEH